jgi:hypothetical protein
MTTTTTTKSITGGRAKKEEETGQKKGKQGGRGSVLLDSRLAPSPTCMTINKVFR